jgi:glycosyltransferase involved in cell wall biosynthesis
MSVQQGSRAIRVCGLVPYPLGTTPSQRFRLEQWAARLHDSGIALDLIPFADSRLLHLLRQPGRLAAKMLAFGAAFVRRLTALVAAPRYDAVVIHRAVCLAGPALPERLLRLFHRPIIFDFDDAVFLLHTSSANRRFGWLKCPRKTETLCRLSTHVVAGNAGLADYASRFNANVTVVPSSVDTDHYRPGSRNNGARVVVGWTGSSTSQTHLEQFAPVLRDLTAHSDVELRVHSDRAPDLPGVRFVWRPWSAETELAELSAFDIGIMPMPDDPWARGKCAMKALLYMAMGVPAVCSPVGTNRTLIQHGENGVLAATPEDWLTSLRELIENAALRRRLGDAGRNTVEERYSARTCAASFGQLIRHVVDTKAAFRGTES